MSNIIWQVNLKEIKNRRKDFEVIIQSNKGLHLNSYGTLVSRYFVKLNEALQNEKQVQLINIICVVLSFREYFISQCKVDLTLNTSEISFKVANFRKGMQE